MRGTGDDAEPTGRKGVVERDGVIEPHEIVVADEHQRRMREASEVVGRQVGSVVTMARNFSTTTGK